MSVSDLVKNFENGENFAYIKIVKLNFQLSDFKQGPLADFFTLLTASVALFLILLISEGLFSILLVSLFIYFSANVFFISSKSSDECVS